MANGGRLVVRILKASIFLVTAGLFGLGLFQALRANPVCPWLGSLRNLFFGTMAPLTLVFSTSVSAWCFLEIVRRYHTLRGFPWLVSSIFAAAATAAVLSLHALLSP
jgi:hypothetical protein